MSKVVISTIGTSLLTNQIDRSNPDEKNWYSQLRDSANLTSEQTPEDILTIIEALKAKASQTLEKSSVAKIRSASAELNGIYGLYDEQLKNGTQDMHWLIATDTAQGEETAKIVKAFLLSQGLGAEIYTPKGLSTASTRSFSDGINELLTELKTMIDGYQKVCFNLVGGFKSLQAYLNTIGMFYADEIIYIFEGVNSEVIKIPRLPIKIDEAVIEPYTLEMALMSAGMEVHRSEIGEIQEALIFELDGEVTLSTWGELIWDQTKTELLSGELLNFPKLRYESSFVQDYQRVRNNNERVKLQETLAKVSKLLSQSRNAAQALRGDGGVQLETYKNTTIDHFRVNLSMRVSCKLVDGDNLSLRHYGTHDHVERSEKV
ncbi:MAG: putative CRISPR-associated protein [Limnoraphis sp.]